ncbi:SRPBCC family protein [Legionella sp. km772]|uniref:SRPBCC family protein n=1 Tax=Legionella sp. km772 TaxID=2498111 RepID=UPI000F8F741A|nr:SRPBCC family protein [Legionella sp. km772]RUR04806.1 polyketide cyclase [Legionella sp. km772]
MPNTVNLHRVINAPPERVFQAFQTPDALAKWIPPYGFTCLIHKMEFQVGGEYKMSFKNLTTGSLHSFGGRYLEIISNQLIKYSDQFDDPNLLGTMLTTITLRKVSCGTELIIVQEGIPEMIPVEQCYLGWQQSLNLLLLLVEPEIPDNA